MMRLRCIQAIAFGRTSGHAASRCTVKSPLQQLRSQRTVSPQQRRLLSTSTRSSGSDYILIGCVGLSTAVFGLWTLCTVYQPRTNPYAVFGQSKSAIDRLSVFLRRNFILRPQDWSDRPWTLVTSAFSHINAGHFLFNTMTLWVFGSMVAPVVPPVYFSTLVLGSALASSGTWLWHNSSRSDSSRRAALGMSGIVQGVGAAAACMFPRAQIAVFGILPMNLAVFVGGYCLLDLYFLNSERSTIGHAAHLGGVAFGLGYYALGLRRFGGFLR